MTLDRVVVGTGPAAFGAVAGLVEAGATVTVIDVGRELSSEAAALRDRLASTEPQGWAPADLAKLENRASHSSPPKKRLFGSSFAYEMPDGRTLAGNAFGGQYSHAFGGLSTVWGSAVLPYRQADLGGWPISAAELQPHYEAILRDVPLAGEDDALASLFPTFARDLVRLPASQPSASLLRNLWAHRKNLRGSGIIGGAARLAVRADSPGKGGPCRACGVCMYGCPYDLIYSTKRAFEGWVNAGSVRLLRGLRLERFEERAGAVHLDLSDAGGIKHTMACTELFLACGTMETARLVLEAYAAFDRPIVMRESRLFVVPFVLNQGSGHSTRPPRSLAEAFVEILDASGVATHLQFYPYSPFVENQLTLSLPLRWLTHPRVRSVLASRLMVVQGFAHSNHSAPIGLQLRRLATGNVLEILTERQNEMPVRRALDAFNRASSLTGGRAITQALQFAAAGASFHTGATFPMRSRPIGMETTTLGVPLGFSRVRLVDASTFPSIPATTIALPAMANARRIAVASAP